MGSIFSSAATWPHLADMLDRFDSEMSSLAGLQGWGATQLPLLLPEFDRAREELDDMRSATEENVVAACGWGRSVLGSEARAEASAAAEKEGEDGYAYRQRLEVWLIGAGATISSSIPSDATPGTPQEREHSWIAM